jgi:restriction endonuclease
MPRPKRRNAVVRLFDAPLYRDLLFWFMAVWVVIAIWSVLEFGKPSGMPRWLNALLSAAFFALISGILPAWGRLAFRRHRWSQQQTSRSEPSEAKRTRTRTASTSSQRRPPRPDADEQPQPHDPHDAMTGLGVTAADPTLVGIEDEATPAPTPVRARLQWDRLDADGFERLLVRFLEESGAYTNVTRLMNVNAADAGRDIEAYQRVGDGLVSERLERVIVQAKHWPKRGIGSSAIADLVHAKLPFWEGEPVRVLIVATTGSFTQDAVRWVDNHNRAAKRPDIVLWSSNELDNLLRRWPALIDELGLFG